MDKFDREGMSMSVLKFSLLLSIYIKESPEYFDACMQSLWFEQTVKPNEIILVKDGPLTADLDEVIIKWQDKLKNILIVVELEHNKGLGEALNIGLSQCTNEWVFRMDTDDICFMDRFEKQVNFLTKYPEVDILSGQVIEFDIAIDNITGYKKVPLTHKDIIKFSKFRNPFNHMAVAYRKSIIELVGGYQHHVYMEDYNLWLRVLAAGYIGANLDSPLVLVNAGKEMIRRRSGKIYVESEWKLFKLKTALNYQSTLPAISTLMARSIPRLLPHRVLTRVYSMLRKN